MSGRRIPRVKRALVGGSCLGLLGPVVGNAVLYLFEAPPMGLHWLNLVFVVPAFLGGTFAWWATFPTAEDVGLRRGALAGLLTAVFAQIAFWGLVGLSIVYTAGIVPSDVVAGAVGFGGIVLVITVLSLVLAAVVLFPLWTAAGALVGLVQGWYLGRRSTAG